MPKRRKPDETFPCPFCGEDVRLGAKFCRACGASEESGWGEDEAWQADAPGGYGEDDDFDYDEFVSREFPDAARASSRPRAKQVAIFVIALVLAAAILAWSVGL